MKAVSTAALIREMDVEELETTHKTLNNYAPETYEQHCECMELLDLTQQQYQQQTGKTIQL